MPRALPTLGLVLLAPLLANACSAPPASDDAAATPGPVSYGALGARVELTFPERPTPFRSDRPTALVRDRGFDLRHAALQGKVVGAYHLECSAVAEPPVSAGTIEERAAALITRLRVRDERCQVVPGVTVTVEGYLDRFNPDRRAAWNRGLWAKDDAALAAAVEKQNVVPLLARLVATEGAFVYHGTHVAGLVAYDADVNLVIVDDQAVATAEEANEAFPCHTQREIDDEVALWSRPDVQDAFIHAPLSREDEDLLALRREFGVRVENRSFGLPSRSEFEGLHRAFCPERVDLREYYRLSAGLEERREAAKRAAGVFEGADPLIVQAAGNDGASLVSSEDKLECYGSPTTLLVGSYELVEGEPALSAFSARGECVAVYGLGQDVIAPAPGDFYGIVSGTSFATPLTARLAVKLAPEAPTTTALREAVLAQRDGYRILGKGSMPAELSTYLPADQARPPVMPAVETGRGRSAPLGARRLARRLGAGL